MATDFGRRRQTHFVLWRPRVTQPPPKLVIGELPPPWARRGLAGNTEIDIGSFRDVLALVDPNEQGANFAGSAVLAAGRSYLTELGVNALELLPPADSWVPRQWGYATSNY